MTSYLVNKLYTLVVYHSHRKTGWSTVVVNGRRQVSNGNFHRDARLVPFPRLFPGRQDQRRSKAKGLELVKTSKRTFSIRKFGPPFKKSCFPVRGDKFNLAIYILNAIQNFRNFWANGKQAVCHVASSHTSLSRMR